MNPRATPAPGPFVHLHMVDSWDGPLPKYKIYMLSNDDAEELAYEILDAVHQKLLEGETDREPRTPFHGKPNEPIEYKSQDIPKL